jgi:acyl-CoA thioesterase-1
MKLIAIPFRLRLAALLIPLLAITAIAAEPVKSSRPRVLILGDSISIGYTPFVKEMLKDEAVVVRPMRPNGRAENCSGTTLGVTEIDRWLKIDGGNWDVIHFNWGLHDLKRQKPDGTASDDPNDAHQADPAKYEQNLREIVKHLKATNAKLILATTTPVPEKVSPHRDPQDVVRYNEIAQKIAKENDIAIDDLYAFAMPKLSEIQRPANVHFTEAGSKVLAEQVAASIRKALK